MTNTEKQIEEIIDKVFQSVMSDIGMHYKVSDRLSDILSDSLSEHLPTKITQALAEDRERVRGIKHKLWTAKSYYSTVGGDERNIGRNLMADDLLSYLTPPNK